MKSKLTFSIVALLLVVSVWAMAAGKKNPNGGLTAADHKAVEAEVYKRIKVTAKPITAKAVAAVFDAKFIEVEIRVPQSGGHSTSDLTLVKQGDAFIEIEQTSTSQAMPKLTSLVGKKFKLADDASAALFEAALDALYPISKFGDDKDHKAVTQKGKTWHFVRGEFFDDKKGFVVTTDNAGKITDINFKLKMSKK